jgi:hypothetical protein
LLLSLDHHEFLPSISNLFRFFLKIITLVVGFIS